MHCRYADRSPEDYYSFGEKIAQSLDEEAKNYNWLLRFVLTFVAFNLDNFSALTPSLWMWFYAAGHSSEEATASREVFISRLREALVDEKLNLLLEGCCSEEISLK
jgi:hypothetical protein